MTFVLTLNILLLILSQCPSRLHAAWLPDVDGSHQLPKGEVVTIHPPNSQPTLLARLHNQQKIFAPSNSCSKNVLLGCPGVQLVPNNNIPAPNGCGPGSWDETSVGRYFKSILNQPWSRSCCDAHDLCFDSCDSTYNQCNVNFRDCLVQNCAGQPDCAAFVSFYTTAVESNLGCKVYVGDPDPAKNHCKCPEEIPGVSRQGRYRQYFVVLDTYTTNTLRSRFTDTNTVIVGVDINGVPSAGGELAKFQGHQGPSHQSTPGLVIYFWAFDSDVITPWVSIYNGDLSTEKLSDLKSRLNSLNLMTGINALGSIIRLIQDIPLANGDAIMKVFSSAVKIPGLFDTFSWLFPNCDGFVLSWKITLNGSQIVDSTTFQYEQPGYQSAGGCGATSFYSAKIRIGFGGGQPGVIDIPSGQTPTVATAIPNPVASVARLQTIQSASSTFAQASSSSQTETSASGSPTSATSQSQMSSSTSRTHLANGVWISSLLFVLILPALLVSLR